MEWLRRLLYLFRRRKLERQLRNEMEFHREMMQSDGRARFGNELRLREEAQDVWGWTWLDRLWQDVRFAARLFRRSPLLALTAVLVLGLGIGVNLTAFGLFDILVLKPLPVRDPQSLYRLRRRNATSQSTRVQYPAIRYYAENCPALAAVVTRLGDQLTLGTGTERVSAEFVTANFFSELGISSAYGRAFDASTDDAAGALPVVVLSYGFWRRQYGSDRSIIGKTIRLNRRPATVVGVAPFDFPGLTPDRVDLWIPITLQPYFVQGSDLLSSFSNSGPAMYARLKPGVTPAAAESALQPLVDDLRREHPADFWNQERLVVSPGAYLAEIDAHDMPMVALFAALVALVLAVACANVGNLLLAHGLGRERELTIRVSVGASRGRILRQLITESLLLAACGTLLGLLLSAAGLRFLLSLVDTSIESSLWPDARVVIAAFAIGLLSTVVFGVVPALRVSRLGHCRTRARAIFVAAQLAASCVLLIVASLLVRALQHAGHSDLGFDHQHVIVVDPALHLHGYQDAVARSYFERLRERLAQVPGVEVQGLATVPPLGNSISQYGIREPRRAEFYMNSVDAGFLPALAIPLVRGRNFLPQDQDGLVVSAALARQLWPGEDPVGKTLRFTSKRVVTVIGVARDAHAMVVRDAEGLDAYQLLQPDDYAKGVLVVRTLGDPAALAMAAREAAAVLNPSIVPDVRLLRTSLQEKLRASAMLVLITGCMGVLALTLAVVGLYGAVSYAVTQRTKEIGIRMAVGASSQQVMADVIGQFLPSMGIALVGGLTIAAVVSIALRRALFGISNLDPISYAAAVALLGITAIAAALIPARRASRIDPMIALRCD